MNTKPDNSVTAAGVESNIQLGDVFDAGELQRIQDLFSDAAGVASLITDTNGIPITRPANFCRLCTDIVRTTDKGLANCHKSDASLGRLHPDGPLVQSCFGCGLWKAGVNITVGGNHIANWLIGPIRNEYTDERQMLQYADEIGADKAAFLNALSEIPVMSKAQLDTVAQMLFVFANALSEKASQIYKLKVEVAEQQNANAWLRANESRFKDMFSRHSSVMLLIEPESGRILDANLAAAVFYGYSRENLLSMHIDEINILDAVRLDAARKNALSENSNYFVFPHRLANGEVRQVEVHSSPVDFQGNRLLFSIIHDISGRQQVEEALRASTEFANSLIASMHDGVSVLDKNGVHINVNPAFCRMTGFGRDELIGSGDPYPYWPPEEYAPIRAALQKTMAGQEQSFDLVFMRKNGERFPVLVNPFAVKDKQGEIVSFSATVIDISERKQAEETLRETNAYLDNLINYANAPIIVWDPQFRITRFNYAFESLTGKNENDIVGQSLEVLFSPPLAEASMALIRKTLTGEPGETIELEVLGPDESRRTVLWNMATLYAPDGITPLASIAQGQDITGRKLAEEALLQSKLQLEQAHRLAGAGTWDWDMLSQKLVWSNELYALFGLDPDRDEANFDTWTRIVHPDDRTEAAFRIEQAVEAKTPLDSEYRVVHPDGKVRWISSLGNTVYDSDGQPLQMTGICTDITGRKLAEEAMRESERLYRSLFGNMLNGFAFCRMVPEEGKPPDFVYLAVNDAFEVQTGLKNVVGRKLSEVIPGFQESDPGLLNTYCRVALSGQAEKFEIFVEALQKWFAVSVYCPMHEHFVAVFEGINDRKLAEKALVETNAYLDNLINNASAPIIVWDTHFHITRFNHAFESLTGYLECDVLGQSPGFLFPADQLLSSMDLIRNTLSAERRESVEIDILHRDTSIRTVLWNLATLFAPAGKTPVATIAQGLDITLRKQMEESLAQSEQQFRGLFENSIDGVAIHQILLDEQGNPADYIFLHANAAFETHTGLALADIIGKRVTEVIPGTEKTQLIGLYGKVALSGEQTSFEIYFAPLQKYYHINVYQLGYGRFVTVFQNITERRNASQALQKSEERYRGLLTNLEAGVVVHAPDTSIVMNNQKASELLGLNDDQLRGKQAIDPYWRFLDENGLPLLVDDYPVSLIVATQKPFRNRVLGVIQSTTHNIVWLTVNGFPVFDQQGELSEILISFNDITHRKLAEDELRLKNLVFDASLAANSIARPDGMVTEANGVFLNLWGYQAKEEVIGKSIAEFILDPADGLDIITALNNSDAWEGDYAAKKKDGSVFIAHGLATTIKDSNGRLIGYQSAVIDITERKRAEETLKQSELAKSQLLAKLNEAQHIAAIGSWEWDLKSNVVWWSDETYRIFEVDAPGFVPGFETNSQFIHPDDLGLYNSAFDNALRTGQPLNTEIRIVAADNSLKYCHVEGAVFNDSAGQPLRITGTILDISLQKVKENALRDSERKFRDTVANLDEGYYSVTTDGLLLDHNQAFSRILGYVDTADLKGIHMTDFWQNPENRKVYLDALLQNGFIANFLISIKMKSGEIRSVIANSHLVKDDDNRPVRIEGVFLDITDRIRTEESLRRHAGRLQNLHKIDHAILHSLETSGSIVRQALQHTCVLLSCHHAKVGIFDFGNDALQVFDTDPEGEVIVEATMEIVDEAAEILEMLRLNRLKIVDCMSHESSRPELLKILCSEGTKSCLHMALISGEKFIGVMNLGWIEPHVLTTEEIEIAKEVGDEITIAIEQDRLRQETKVYAEKMEQMVALRTAQLLEANKELEAFSYSVSHDLRAPLRHISGFVELLVKSFHGSLSEKEKHYLDSIAGSVYQMGLLIDDLLQFSRTGRQEMRQTRLNMNVVLHEAVQAVKHDAKGRNIKWDIAVLPPVFGDAALLRLVWVNLLSNAVKFARNNVVTHIEVGLQELDAEFVFFVRDNGAGFDMQYAHKLFGVFQRLHSVQEFEGTGIGLANVRRIILRHGGRTWAESEVGKGAVFYFSLPKK